MFIGRDQGFIGFTRALRVCLLGVHCEMLLSTDYILSPAQIASRIVSFKEKSHKHIPL